MVTSAGPAPRRRRANGEESRQRILDAAAEIAGERGYDGTSIALVSERSGLPASSIYWHFEDKDTLIAAVIERSFIQWASDMSSRVPIQEGASRVEIMGALLQRTARALLASPDFLRLGLMLTLERRPDELSARTVFLRTRGESFAQMVASYEKHFPDLDDTGVRDLATFTMAMADGLFIAREIRGDDMDLVRHFEMLAVAVLSVADDLAKRSTRAHTVA